MPRAIALSLFSGLLLGLSFPPFSLSYGAWFALVPLFLIPFNSRRESFLWGWCGGFVANLIVFFWIWKTFQAAQLGVGTTLLCWIALSAILAVYVGIFLSLTAPYRQRWYGPVLSAAVWVSLDYFKGHLLTGFPWALLSHTQAFHPLVIQISSLTGAEGVTFLIVLFNATLAQPVKKKVYVVPLVLIGVLAYGAWQLSRPETPHRLFPVALLQGNIDQYQKWDQLYEKRIRDTYESLAFQAARDTETVPEVIIWPESAVPGWYPNEKFYFDWIKSIATNTHTHHLIGAVSSTQGLDTNSAFLIHPEGYAVKQYDKIHLVPFGEYVPFGSFAKRWIPYLGQLGTFSAGRNYALFPINGIRLAPNICFEAIFPGLVRTSLKQGGDVIVNITNDGWYLDTGAPLQHFVANVFRALENGRPVVRAANTGISGLISRRGVVEIMSGLNQKTAVNATLKIPLDPPTTLYALWGPWFSWVCVLSSMGFFLLMIYSGRVARIKNSNR